MVNSTLRKGPLLTYRFNMDKFIVTVPHFVQNFIFEKGNLIINSGCSCCLNVWHSNESGLVDSLKDDPDYGLDWMKEGLNSAKRVWIE